MTTRPTPEQLRGARAMLGWSMFDLAKGAQVSVSTIKRIENMALENVSTQTIAAVSDCLSHAGVTFLTDDGKGVGIRLS